jgi:glyoxylase-like metal-dependent hydrolase (beta-lactamase superfamily II)
MAVGVERVVTSGQFSLDGGTWDVDNNVWIVGDASEAIVVDAAHDADAIEAVVGDRRLVAILCTHGHNDHVNAARDLAERRQAPVLLHPDDRVLWDMTHDRAPDGPLQDGQILHVSEEAIEVLHTPGHAPGACCFYLPAQAVLFSGDTLFNGGPGATGRSYSDFPTIIESIESRLLGLPPETRVLTGHGAETTIGAERPHLQEWIDRGH